MQCAVCSVRCGVSREGHGRDRLSSNYRSFMFGKLPLPACPGLCYIMIHLFSDDTCLIYLATIYPIKLVSFIGLAHMLHFLRHVPCLSK